MFFFLKEEQASIEWLCRWYNRYILSFVSMYIDRKHDDWILISLMIETTHFGMWKWYKNKQSMWQEKEKKKDWISDKTKQNRKKNMKNKIVQNVVEKEKSNK